MKTPIQRKPSTIPDQYCVNFDIGLLTFGAQVEMKQTNLGLTFGQMRGGAEN